MRNSGRVELLAPAGNAEGFYGAAHAGADAVYLAGSRFGARAYAENFTAEELVKCIRYGHLLGKKIYLAVNTLLKEQELQELYEYLLPFYEAGLDAVIVQDPGVLRLVRESFPELKIHASTQMTLCSSYGISLLKAMGVSRVVPARELSLQEIELLKGNAELAGMEIECFVHGAMCYCYSGQCLFSSILGGRSGNRGRCAQPCRLPYTVDAAGRRLENCYPLSLKDLCAIGHIPRLVEAGIDSFKIEGRMKKPEYTAGVTQVYRHYLDRYYELREKKGAEEAAEAYQVDKRDWKRLYSLYIRSEAQDGYYFRHNGGDMVTLGSPAYSGSDDTLLSEIREKYIDSVLKLPVVVKAVFQAGEPAQVTLDLVGKEGENLKGNLKGKEISSTVKGEIVRKAEKKPVNEENVESRLGRLGDSVFYAEKTEILLGEGVFFPLGQINELRRNAVAGLEEKILLARGYHGERKSGGNICGGTGRNEVALKESGYSVSVRSLQQLEAVAAWNGMNGSDAIRRIYVDSDLLVCQWKESEPLCRKLSAQCGIFATLPYIVRAADSKYLEKVYAKVAEGRLFQGILVRSLDGLGFLREKERKGAKDAGERNRIICRGDAGVYVWNQSAGKELENLLDGFCLPYELNAPEQMRLLDGHSWEKIVYGRIPMMITANCLQRTAGRCAKKARTSTAPEGEDLPASERKETSGETISNIVLRDRYHKEFPVEINCFHCMNIIYNSVALSLHKELSKWKDRVVLRLDFTLESRKETEALLDSFIKETPILQRGYTAGHERRGVE